jgi:hypothetical protein
MNLLERLKLEHLDKLNDEEINYPGSVKVLRAELSEVNQWCYLKYNTICNLAIYLGTYDYSPSGIDKLFSHEEH